MKCPNTKEECWGEGCVKWHKGEGKCMEVVYLERSIQATAMAAQMQTFYTELLNSSRMMRQLSIQQIIRDPTVPEELRKKLQEATDSEEAERLLREAGLL
jgi:hypothetical protein